jgi:hypothetical protein
MPMAEFPEWCLENSVGPNPITWPGNPTGKSERTNGKSYACSKRWTYRCLYSVYAVELGSSNADEEMMVEVHERGEHDHSAQTRKSKHCE